MMRGTRSLVSLLLLAAALCLSARAPVGAPVAAPAPAAPAETADPDAADPVEDAAPGMHGLTLQVMPALWSKFRTSVSSDANAGYTKVLPGWHSGQAAALGWSGSMMDVRYLFEQDRIAVDKAADVAQTPANPADDVFVEEVVRSQHVLSVGRIAPLRFWRLSINMGWGIAYGTLDFRQRTPAGTRETQRRRFSNLLFMYEPMVELATLGGLRAYLSYSAFLPLFVWNDFTATTHGPGLLLRFNWGY